ncbi:glycosyltransferase family 4 protein [Patescibacteria group bacterium]|nr:glycosyltransferase family 4 protein [Patescibacteria group bacterium]
MIIGIDITSVAYGTGVSNYTYNLVKNLLINDKKNHYKLFFSSWRLKLPAEMATLAAQYPNCTLFIYRLPPTFLSLLWNRLHVFPIEQFIGDCDIFHTSDWTQPPTAKAKSVCTIHDLTPFLFPHWLHPKIVSTHRLKMFWASREASRFICVSQNTQKDLLKLYPNIDPAKTMVIYEAAEEKYNQFYKLKAEHKSQLISSIKNKYHLHDFLLAQGTREPRKNLHRLVQAFVRFKTQHPKSNLELAITGKYGWGEDIEINRPDIKILGFVDENDLVQLHAAATALVYPSLYEGFGLPVIKAMAVGTPVITSHNSSLIEVGDNAALLIDPYSVSAIKSAISKITKTDARNALIKKGLVQAKKFSWEITAQNTLKLYQQLGNK